MAGYDYVIVGAGSAGCVLAARLSETREVSVLLLEAGGPDNRREIHIPAAFSKLFKSQLDWNYSTDPQLNLHGRQLYWPRGKVIGGSSSINAMIYIRGNARDYDDWERLGNPGWSFEDVLPFFLKSENQARIDSEFHGRSGPLRVEDLRTINPLSRAFVEAAVETGLPRNEDFNGPVQEGVGFYQVTQKRGRRWSAADAFLHPARRRRNLTILPHAHATQILVEKLRATGVEYVHEGREHAVRARREVILCGGSINSPQLLLLSGIGAAKHLEETGIEIVHDLPGVGENLQDHLFLPVAFECKRSVSLARAESLPNFLHYAALRRGMLTSNVAEAGGFLRTRPDADRPNLQYHFGPVYYLEHGFVRPPGHGFSIGPTLIRPESRGRIRLRTTFPMDPPRIEPNYLSHASEVGTFVAGIELARRIAAAKAFDAYRGKEFLPGAEVRTRSEIATYVRDAAETTYHPVGTCKMGCDAMAVVDSHLRLRGIDGLRAVDASVMPTVPSGNTNAPTIMIAEMAADMIRSGN
ncbi:MAG: choline dehydrogenase [Candidatus Acidiferrales bacterium]